MAPSQFYIDAAVCILLLLQRSFVTFITLIQVILRLVDCFIIELRITLLNENPLYFGTTAFPPSTGAFESVLPNHFLYEYVKYLIESETISDLILSLNECALDSHSNLPFHKFLKTLGDFQRSYSGSYLPFTDPIPNAISNYRPIFDSYDLSNLYRIMLVSHYMSLAPSDHSSVYLSIFSTDYSSVIQFNISYSTLLKIRDVLSICIFDNYIPCYNPTRVTFLDFELIFKELHSLIGADSPLTQQSPLLLMTSRTMLSTQTPLHHVNFYPSLVHISMTILKSIFNCTSYICKPSFKTILPHHADMTVTNLRTDAAIKFFPNSDDRYQTHFLLTTPFESLIEAFTDDPPHPQMSGAYFEYKFSVDPLLSMFRRLPFELKSEVIFRLLCSYFGTCACKQLECRKRRHTHACRKGKVSKYSHFPKLFPCISFYSYHKTQPSRTFLTMYLILTYKHHDIPHFIADEMLSTQGSNIVRPFLPLSYLHGQFSSQPLDAQELLPHIPFRRSSLCAIPGRRLYTHDPMIICEQSNLTLVPMSRYHRDHTLVFD